MGSAMSETWGHAIPDQLPPLLEQFHKAISQYTENIALTPNANTENWSYLRWNFQEFGAGVKRLKAGLASLGVRRGMAIVTLLPNCAEFALTWWAAMELEAVVAPLDPRRLSNIPECSHMLKTILEATSDTRPVVIAWKTEYFQSRAIQSLDVHAKIAVSNWQLSQDCIPIRDVMEESKLSFVSHSTETATESDPNPKLMETSILFTSGSTSLPKGVWRSHALQATLAYRVFKGNGSETMPGDLWCSVALNCHSVGITSLIAPMLLGAGVVYPGETFSAENTVDALLHERCTHILLVPAMVNAIAESLSSGNQTITGLKAVMIAAAPSTTQHVQTCFDYYYTF